MGCVRTNNEDCFFADDELGLCQYFAAATITPCVRGKREAVLDDLIGDAIRSGGSDNITAVIVDIQFDGESTSCNTA